ncbi:hypothetical protein [Intestinimonas butyriciproducens]|uniref:hypothetical protein n=1 Tax=Intestinimonas butyriciproducens TaxID=1297617 RepID=UPI0018AB12CC|nr:hypothetical protein [Intestinimonas butyriciproducens]
MKQSRIELLKQIYAYDQAEGGPLTIPLESEETGEYLPNVKELEGDIEYLEREGYIVQPLNICMAYIVALTEKGEDFLENNCAKPVHQVSTFDFSGATINNSVIAHEATSNTINCHAEDALAEIQALVAQKPVEDQTLLKELLDELRVMQHSNQPIEKGKLSRFYEVMKKSSDLLLPLAKFFVEILF